MSAETVSPDRITQTRYDFFAAKTLFSAVELDLFTVLDDGPKTRIELENQIGLHHRSSEDFLDALVALGFLEREQDTYRNTPETAHFLVRGKTGYVGGLLEIADNRLYEYWGSLTEALKTGEPQNELKDEDEDTNFFETVYQDEEKLKEFLSGMTGLSMGAAEDIRDEFSWSDHNSFCDIGTAEGVVPCTIASEYDHLDAFGFDLPEVQKHFEEFARERDLDDRVSFVSGDFLEDELPESDVLIMGHVLHDWGFDVKRMLLEKAYRALPDGGKLIIYGVFIDEDRRQHEYGLLLCLNLLIETPGGYAFTREDGERWMEEVGFQNPEVTSLRGATSMIVGTK